MRVKALVKSDIRNAPSHTAGYVRDAIPPEEFDVYQIINKDGTQWHLVGGDPVNGEFWIDGNNGQNLYWIDNPNIVKQPTPQPVYYVIKPGDFLSKIASANGTTVAQLKAWNGIANENLIYAGEKIRVK